MKKEKKRITEDNYVVSSDRVVFYAKEKHNEFKLCSDLAMDVPEDVNIFVEKEKCEKYIQSLNEFADVLHKGDNIIINASTKNGVNTVDSIEVPENLKRKVWACSPNGRNFAGVIAEPVEIEKWQATNKVIVFNTYEKCKSYIEAINAPNLAPKTILDDIHQHIVDKLVFWEQYKIATDPLDKEIALLAMLQESNTIITKLKNHVQDSAN